MAARGHRSHMDSQDTTTQSMATAGNARMLQNIAHSSWSCWPPLSNIIGDIIAIDKPNAISARFTIMSRPSASFIRSPFA